MTPPPACPTCRLPLRWFPPQNQWGCDRCQKLYPANIASKRAPGLPTWTGLAIAGGAVVLGLILVLALKKGDDHRPSVYEAGYGGSHLDFGGGGGGADCDRAVANAATVAKDMMKSSGLDESKLTRLDEVLHTRCTTDDWPSEVITCMSELSTQAELEECMKKLPPDAVEKLSSDIMALMKE